jgi:hypothetical protein
LQLATWVSQTKKEEANNQQLDNVSNNGGDELDGSVSGSQQEVGLIHRLREVSPRPLERPQVSAGRATASNANADSIQAMVLAMVCRTQRDSGLEEEQREERQEERRRYDARMELQREETQQQMEAQRQQMEAQCKERHEERQEQAEEQLRMQQMNMQMIAVIMNQLNRKHSWDDDANSNK